MSNKYNFQLRSKVGAGLYGGNRYFSAWLNSDGDALSLADSVSPFLSNYTRVGVSRQIRLVPNFEIPASPSLTDTFLARFLMISSAKKAYSIDLPVSPSVDFEQIVKALNQVIKDESGNSCKCLSYRIIGQNIIHGGVVD